MGIQFCFSSKPIMKSLLLVALAFAAVVVAEPEADAAADAWYGYYGHPGYYGYGRYGYYGDTTVWDTADTTADTGRGKPRLRPNPLPPLRPTPLPMPTTDTTDTAVLMDTTVDTTDTVWDTTAVTADTGIGKPRLMPNPKLMPPLMLGTDTTVIVMDTTVILIDTTDTDTVMPVLTDTTAVTGGKL